MSRADNQDLERANAIGTTSPTWLPLRENHTHISQMVSHRRASPISVIAHGLSSPCIQRSQRKEITRLLSDGNKILRESLSSCVLVLSSVISVRTNGRLHLIDRSILYCRRYNGFCINPGSQTQPPRYLCVLYRENVSTPGQPQCIPPIQYLRRG